MADHVNGNTLDNRRENLRVVTPTENQLNRRGARSDSRSGVRGVCWHGQTGRWTATYRGRYLGIFPTIEEAAATYAEASKTLKP
jgi:hypothetical protein